MSKLDPPAWSAAPLPPSASNYGCLLTPHASFDRAGVCVRDRSNWLAQLCCTAWRRPGSWLCITARALCAKTADAVGKDMFATCPREPPSPARSGSLAMAMNQRGRLSPAALTNYFEAASSSASAPRAIGSLRRMPQTLRALGSFWSCRRGAVAARAIRARPWAAAARRQRAGRARRQVLVGKLQRRKLHICFVFLGFLRPASAVTASAVVHAHMRPNKSAAAAAPGATIRTRTTRPPLRRAKCMSRRQ